jgi:20S proteasome subunit alpha 5
MTLGEAQALALSVLKQVMEERLSPANVEVALVTARDGFQVLGGDALTAAIEGL